MTTTKTKPKRKYTRRTIKSAAPQPPEQPTTEQGQQDEPMPILTNEQAREVASNNIIPKLKEECAAHIKTLDGEIKQGEEDINDLHRTLAMKRTEREKVTRTLSVLRSTDKQ